METSVLPASKTSSGDPQNRSCYTRVEMVLKPILLSMKLAGVYFDPTPSHNKIEDLDEFSPTRTISRTFFWFSSRFYCYSVLFLVWFNLVRCVVGLFPLDEGFPFRVIVTTWYLQCALNSTIMVASCQRLRHLSSFYKHWDSLFKNSTTQQIGCGLRSPKTFINVAVAVGWMFFVTNMVTSSVFLFGNLQTSELFISSFSRPFPQNNLTTIIVAILQIFENSAWIFPITFYSILCRLIKAQFNQFGRCLSKQIDDANGMIPNNFKELRCRYTQLCQAVNLVNGSFKWLLGLSFMIEVLLACFISYQMINTPPEFMSIFTYGFWLSTCFLFIVVLAISSSDVHDAAHSLLDDMFRIGTKDATTDQLGQLNLFVCKLTGTSIGFTAVDFFVITKEFLLTIVGLYLTYFFLLLQFKIT